MKFKLIFLSLLGLVFYGCSENNENVEIIESKGQQEIPMYAKLHVKTKMVTAYEFKFGEPDGSGVKMYETAYNEKGKLTDSVVYNENKVMFHEKYSYNIVDELVKREILDSIGNVLQRSERKFDDKGNEIEFTLHNGDSLFYMQRKEYNEKDELTKLTEYDSKGKAKLIGLFDYNEAGKVISQTETNGAGMKLSKMTYTYDKDGHRTSITNYNLNGFSEGKTLLKEYQNENAQLIEKYDANDSLYASYRYEYDEQGNETKSIIFNGIGQILRQSNSKYDARGNKLQFEIYEGEVGFLGKDVLTYDEDNKEKELVVYDDNNKQVKRKVTEYNDKGLINKEINFNKIDEPMYQFVYTYTYFK